MPAESEGVADGQQRPAAERTRRGHDIQRDLRGAIAVAYELSRHEHVQNRELVASALREVEGELMRIEAELGGPEREHVAPGGLGRTLVELGEEEGWPVRYAKLHGALANMAAEEPAIAAICFAACEGLVKGGIAILAIDNSAQSEMAEGLGFHTIREAYADRAYQTNGLLVPRQLPGSVLHDKLAISERAVRLARHGEIVAVDGGVIRTTARSLCIHGDTPDAVAIARAVKSALFLAGVEIRPAL